LVAHPVTQERKRPPKEPRLLEHALDWLKEIVIVALHQALRKGEVLALQKDDVDFVNGKLHVRRQIHDDGTIGPCKGQSQEDFERGVGDKIDLMPAARKVLAEKALQAGPTGWLFVNRYGEPRSHGDIDRAYGNARDRAGLPETEDGKVVFHSLRHTGISRPANHPGVPLVHVQEFARHKDIKTTMSYVHKIESEQVVSAMAEALSGTGTEG
jgi:integrase